MSMCRCSIYNVLCIFLSHVRAIFELFVKDVMAVRFILDVSTACDICSLRTLKSVNKNSMPSLALIFLFCFEPGTARCMYMYICTYTYKYIERESEREREMTYMNIC